MKDLNKRNTLKKENRRRQQAKKLAKQKAQKTRMAKKIYNAKHIVDDQNKVKLCISPKVFNSLDKNLQKKIDNNNVPYKITHQMAVLKPKGKSGNVRRFGFYAGKDKQGYSHFHFFKNDKKNAHSSSSKYMRVAKSI